MILLTPLDLTLASFLIMVLAGLSWWTGIELEKQIIISALRSIVQLLLLGLVLKYIFSRIDLFWVAGIAIVMLFTGGREINARQRRKVKGWLSFGIGTVSLFISSFAVAILTLKVVINADPWYTPQYAIPILGMFTG